LKNSGLVIIAVAVDKLSVFSRHLVAFTVGFPAATGKVGGVWDRPYKGLPMDKIVLVLLILAIVVTVAY